MPSARIIPGICDRCGQRFPHHKLRTEYIIDAPTNILVCQSCWDPSHPQLDTRGVRTDDREYVPDARPDSAEWPDVRGLWGWNPVGMPTTSTIQIEIGTVRVTT